MKKVLKVVQFVFLFSILFCVSSCDKDTKSESCTGGSLTFKLNDKDWSGTKFNNTLLKAVSGGIPAKRMDLRATNSDGNQIIVTFTNPGTMEGDCMVTGDYVSVSRVTSSLDNAVFFTYISTETFGGFSALDCTLTITKCDEDNRTISGTFTFIDFTEENIGTTGVFTDLCY